MYTRYLPLDASCRVLDMFFRDGEIFLFRTAIGLLKLQQSELFEMDSFSIGALLTKKKENISEDDLFECISTIQPPYRWFNNLRENFQSLLDNKIVN